MSYIINIEDAVIPEENKDLESKYQKDIIKMYITELKGMIYSKDKNLSLEKNHIKAKIGRTSIETKIELIPLKGELILFPEGMNTEPIEIIKSSKESVSFRTKNMRYEVYFNPIEKNK